MSKKSRHLASSVQSTSRHPIAIQIHFNIILLYKAMSYKLSLSLRFPIQNPVCILSSHKYTHTNPSHLMPLELIIWVTFDVYKH